MSLSNEAIISCMLLIHYNNSHSDVVKCRGSVEHNTELAIGKKRGWWIYRNTSKHLPLSLTDSHTKGEFDRQSSAAQSERNCRI